MFRVYSLCSVDLGYDGWYLFSGQVPTLYFLEIQTHKGILHKIGVTARPIQQRLTEIETDLFIPYKTVAIQILGTWPHRGNVELYFKHRYHNYNYRIGSLTEYFKFSDSDANAALHPVSGSDRIWRTMGICVINTLRVLD